jgi:hypothetical protein
VSGWSGIRFSRCAPFNGGNLDQGGGDGDIVADYDVLGWGRGPGVLWQAGTEKLVTAVGGKLRSFTMRGVAFGGIEFDARFSILYVERIK